MKNTVGDAVNLAFAFRASYTRHGTRLRTNSRDHRRSVLVESFQLEIKGYDDVYDAYEITANIQKRPVRTKARSSGPQWMT